MNLVVTPSSLKQHEFYSDNLVGDDYVVGDIHGCYDQLMSQLKRVGFNKGKDRLFSVGDLSDRGPDSLKCLELIHEDWFHSIIGNHEYIMMDAILNEEPYYSTNMWLRNGGYWAYQMVLDSEEDVLKDLCKNYHKNIPITATITVGSYSVGLSHAEPPVNSWAVTEAGMLSSDEIIECLWSRNIIRSKSPIYTEGIDLTIHGHTIMDDKKFLGNALFIDTGSYHKEAGSNYKGVQVYKIKDLLKEY